MMAFLRSNRAGLRISLHRALSIMLTIAMVTSMLPMASISVVIAYAAEEEVATEDSSSFTLGEIGGYLQGEIASMRRAYRERRFTDTNGHGFVAEEVNNFADRLKGMDARVVGGDNLKNGPDRQIVNRDKTSAWVQDKYYSSAKGSVRAAFDSETGTYRYIKDGQPMQLEVPKDQYDEAVSLMMDKIKEGKVPGVSDPAEAENLVRKGTITYDQAVNLAKAGNIKSLAYDALNGTISAAYSFGISFLFDFAICVKEGVPLEDAINEASKNASISGAAVFAADVLASQLMRTGFKEAMVPTAEGVAKWLGDDACKAILRSARVETAGLTHVQIIGKAAKVLESKVVFNIIFTAALSIPDAVDVFQGRISLGQFVKNLAVIVVGILAAEAGGIAGGMAGSAIPVLGSTAGAIIGSFIGGYAGATVAEVIGNALFKEDAEAMYEIVSDKFSSYCNAYVAGEKEAEELAGELDDLLSEDALKDMFASEDREAYAEELIKPLFERMAANRTFGDLPSDYEIRTVMLNNMQSIVYIH